MRRPGRRRTRIRRSTSTAASGTSTVRRYRILSLLLPHDGDAESHNHADQRAVTVVQRGDYVDGRPDLATVESYRAAHLIDRTSSDASRTVGDDRPTTKADRHPCARPAVSRGHMMMQNDFCLAAAFGGDPSRRAAARVKHEAARVADAVAGSCREHNGVWQECLEAGDIAVGAQLRGGVLCFRSQRATQAAFERETGFVSIFHADVWITDGGATGAGRRQERE